MSVERTEDAPDIAYVLNGNDCEYASESVTPEGTLRALTPLSDTATILLLNTWRFLDPLVEKLQAIG